MIRRAGVHVGVAVGAAVDAGAGLGLGCGVADLTGVVDWLELAPGPAVPGVLIVGDVIPLPDAPGDPLAVMSSLGLLDAGPEASLVVGRARARRSGSVRFSWGWIGVKGAATPDKGL